MLVVNTEMLNWIFEKQKKKDRKDFWRRKLLNSKTVQKPIGHWVKDPMPGMMGLGCWTSCCSFVKSKGLGTSEKCCEGTWEIDRPKICSSSLSSLGRRGRLSSLSLSLGASTIGSSTRAMIKSLGARTSSEFFRLSTICGDTCAFFLKGIVAYFQRSS